MKQYFSNEYLGDVRNMEQEGIWVYAELTPSINMDKFKDFLKLG